MEHTDNLGKGAVWSEFDSPEQTSDQLPGTCRRRYLGISHPTKSMALAGGR